MNNEEVNRNGDKGNITSLYSTRLTTRRILHNWKTMLKKKKKKTTQKKHKAGSKSETSRAFFKQKCKKLSLSYQVRTEENKQEII